MRNDMHRYIDCFHDSGSQVVDEGYDPVYGARPLRRAIMRLLDDKLAEAFLNEPTVEGECRSLGEQHGVDGAGRVVVGQFEGPPGVLRAVWGDSNNTLFCFDLGGGGLL